MSENGRDAYGRFVKGNQIGPGRGGKESIIRGEIREKLLNAINVNMSRFNEVYTLLSPHEKIQALTSLMKYAIPAQANHDLQTGQVINISLTSPATDKDIDQLLGEDTNFIEIPDGDTPNRIGEEGAK